MNIMNMESLFSLSFLKLTILVARIMQNIAWPYSNEYAMIVSHSATLQWLRSYTITLFVCMLYERGDVWIVWRSTRHITSGSKFVYLVVNVACLLSSHRVICSSVLFFIFYHWKFYGQNYWAVYGYLLLLYNWIKTKIDKTGKTIIITKSHS